MKKWSFVVEVDEWNNVKSLVEKKAKEAVGNIDIPDSEEPHIN